MSSCNGSCSTCEDGSCSNRLPPGMLTAYDIDQETADDVLVYIETVGQPPRIHRAVRGVLGKAREISSGRVFGVMFGSAEYRELYDELFSLGVDTLYHMRNRDVTDFQPITYADAIADLMVRIDPATVLFTATPQGRELAPLVAAKAEAGLTADCTVLEPIGRVLRMTRPALGGNINATIVSHFPQMATVRPGVFPEPVPEEGRKGTAISRPYRATKVRSSAPVPSDPVPDIADARILISIGNGVRDRASVDAAVSIAEHLGAAVSCSRAVADKGWLPHSVQVGQSGKTVSPDLYIAFGISGSVQHLAGLRAGKVIAVNKDRDAPIMSIADTAVVGDADAILKKVKDSLEHRSD